MDTTNAPVTAVTYQYRDANNFKAANTLYFAGAITPDGERAIRDTLEADDRFLPGQVGLPNLQGALGDWDDDSDHVWHELLEVEVVTDAAPATSGTITDLVAAFTAVTAWDDAAEYEDVAGG